VLREPACDDVAILVAVFEARAQAAERAPNAGNDAVMPVDTITDAGS
jgi:hypothetical protein